MDKECIVEAVEQLSRPEYLPVSCKEQHFDCPLPSLESIALLVEELRSVIFPGFYGVCQTDPRSLPYYLGAKLDHVYRVLKEQITRGACFFCQDDPDLECQQCEISAAEQAQVFIKRLPEVRKMLISDVQAAFDGDPAAKTPAEIIFCYPSIKALTNYRIAHVLYELGVQVLPRIITELAHSSTGIDIHPGASIGRRFFIDHGTGTVIGETCVIGRNVRIYQGVTLGAKNFPQDKQKRLVKGLPRHPIVEDDVVIYSGATILGRVTIGKGAVIGGNVWITQDVAPGSRVTQVEREKLSCLD